MVKGFPVGDPRASAAGRRGGIVSGEQCWQHALSQIRRHWPTMPLEAQAACKAYGDLRYRAGWKAKRALARTVPR